MRGKSLLPALLLLAVLAAVFLSLPRSGDGTSSGSANGHGKNPGAESVDNGGDSVERYRDVDRASVGSVDFLGKAGIFKESQLVKERLHEMQRTDDEGLELETMPDGHQSIDLKGRFQHVTRLVVAEDGTLVPVCGSPMNGEVSGE